MGTAYRRLSHRTLSPWEDIRPQRDFPMEVMPWLLPCKDSTLLLVYVISLVLCLRNPFPISLLMKRLFLFVSVELLWTATEEQIPFRVSPYEFASPARKYSDHNPCPMRTSRD